MATTCCCSAFSTSSSAEARRMALSNWRTRMADHVTAAMPTKIASAAATCSSCVQPRRRSRRTARSMRGQSMSLCQLARMPRAVAEMSFQAASVAAHAAHVLACSTAAASASASASSRRLSMSLHLMVMVSFRVASCGLRGVAGCQLPVAGRTRNAQLATRNSSRPPGFLQLLLRCEQNPLRVAFADVEDLADLGVAEPFDLEQHEDAAALLGELRQQLAQRHPLGLVDARRCAPAGERVVDLRLLNPPPPLADHVQAGVDQDAIQPRGERRLAGEAARGAMELDEALLHGVFGVGDVAEVVVGERFHPLSEPAIDLGEAIGVAARAAGGQVEIVGLRCGGHGPRKVYGEGGYRHVLDG